MTEEYTQNVRQIGLIIDITSLEKLKVLKRYYKHRNQSHTLGMLINERYNKLLEQSKGETNGTDNKI